MSLSFINRAQTESLGQKTAVFLSWHIVSYIGLYYLTGADLGILGGGGGGLGRKQKTPGGLTPRIRHWGGNVTKPHVVYTELYDYYRRKPDVSLHNIYLDEILNNQHCGWSSL